MKELVILDLDGVIIDGQSQQIFLNYLFQKGIVGTWFYIKITFWFILYKLGLAKNPEKVMRLAYAFTKEKNAQEIDGIVEDFFYAQLKKFIFPEIIDIINEHKQKNRELLIVSNAVDVLLKRVADFLGIKNYIGTKLEVSNGKFTGQILGKIVYGKNKIDCVSSFIKSSDLNLDDSFAYTDHVSDLPLLSIVKNPCAVNPDDSLLSEAERRNWPILKFKNIK